MEQWVVFHTCVCAGESPSEHWLLILPSYAVVFLCLLLHPLESVHDGLPKYNTTSDRIFLLWGEKRPGQFRTINLALRVLTFNQANFSFLLHCLHVIILMMMIVIKVYEMGGLVSSYFYGVFIRLSKKQNLLSLMRQRQNLNVRFARGQKPKTSHCSLGHLYIDVLRVGWS